MNNGLLQVLVEEDFGYKKEGRNWGRAEEHSSLVVNEEAQRWFWNAEQKGGDIKDYLILVRGMNKKAASEIVSTRGRILNGSIFDPVQVKEQMPYDKLLDVMWLLGKGNREYWYSRKIKDKTIDRFRLGFYDGWNLIPLYDTTGLFVNFQMRRDEPKKMIRYWYDYSNPTLLQAELLHLVDTVFITEGTVDSILLNQEGIPSVSQSGGSGYWNIEWFPLFSRLKTIYYIADNDKAGRFAVQRIVKNLGEYRTKVFLFEDKPDKYDTGDYFKEGGNAKGFRQMVEECSKYIFEMEEFNQKKRRKYESWA